MFITLIIFAINSRGESSSSRIPKEQQERRNGGKTGNLDIRGLYQPQMNIKKGCDIKNKHRIQQVEGDEGDRQHQDGAGGSGLRGAFVVSSRGVDVLPSDGV